MWMVLPILTIVKLIMHSIYRQTENHIITSEICHCLRYISYYKSSQSGENPISLVKLQNNRNYWLNQPTVMCIFTNWPWTDRWTDSHSNHSAYPRVVQDYSTDPRVVHVSHSNYRADSRVAQYNTDPRVMQF